MLEDVRLKIALGETKRYLSVGVNTDLISALWVEEDSIIMSIDNKKIEYDCEVRKFNLVDDDYIIIEDPNGLQFEAEIIEENSDDVVPILHLSKFL
jgi:hypothetical protein